MSKSFCWKIPHVYFGVDLKVVWRTLKEDIPRLTAF
jgi:uncharacterized protein with HEPN domain